MNIQRVTDILIGVVLTTALVLALAYKPYKALPPRVATVDLQKLVEEHQASMLKALEGASGAPSDEQRKKMTDNSASFAKRLDAAVGEVAKDCNCLLLNRAALLAGDTEDYTATIRTKIGS